MGFLVCPVPHCRLLAIIDSRLCIESNNRERPIYTHNLTLRCGEFWADCGLSAFSAGPLKVGDLPFTTLLRSFAAMLGVFRGSRRIEDIIFTFAMQRHRNARKAVRNSEPALTRSGCLAPAT